MLKDYKLNEHILFLKADHEHILFLKADHEHILFLKADRGILLYHLYHLLFCWVVNSTFWGLCAICINYCHFGL